MVSESNNWEAITWGYEVTLVELSWVYSDSLKYTKHFYKSLTFPWVVTLSTLAHTEISHFTLKQILKYISYCFERAIIRFIDFFVNPLLWPWQHRLRDYRSDCLDYTTHVTSGKYLNSQSLSFLISKMEKIVSILLIKKIELDNTYKIISTATET